MDGNRFLHNSGDISQISNDLKTNITNYKDEIIELNNLVKRINESSAWKDEQVKTAFISTCNSYISAYKEFSLIMEKYVSYLNCKSNNFIAFESAYSRRG